MFTSAGCKPLRYVYSRYTSEMIYIRVFFVLFLYMGLCPGATNDPILFDRASFSRELP